MKPIIITNNPLVADHYADEYDLRLSSVTYAEVLFAVRDLVHKGHRLLSHPLSGSVKPGETPYKSIMLTGETGPLDVSSLSLIEHGIETAKKFKDHTQGLSDKKLADFRVVDYTLIQSAAQAAPYR